jgi:hypothetical protein
MTVGRGGGQAPCHRWHHLPCLLAAAALGRGGGGGEAGAWRGVGRAAEAEGVQRGQSSSMREGVGRAGSSTRGKVWGRGRALASSGWGSGGLLAWERRQASMNVGA